MFSKDEKIFVTILILSLIIISGIIVSYINNNKNVKTENFITKNNIHIIYIGNDLISQKDKDLKYPSDSIIANLEKIVDKNNKKIGNCTIHLFNPLINSANINPKEWSNIGNYIVSMYDNYDAFIIIQGIDTITYTASALSLMFENLGKPIVLTGFNETVESINNNILSTLKYTSNTTIPEVVIVYNNKVIRGNKSTKIAKNDMEELISYNFPYLAEIDKNYNIKLNKDIALKYDNSKSTTLKLINTSLNVLIIKLYPGIIGSYIKSLISGVKVNAIIFELYGNGNTPTDLNFLQTLLEINDKGIILIGVCNNSINTKLGIDLIKSGVILINNITIESTYAKVLLLLSQFKDFKYIKDNIHISLRGEN